MQQTTPPIRFTASGIALKKANQLSFNKTPIPLVIIHKNNSIPSHLSIPPPNNHLPLPRTNNPDAAHIPHHARPWATAAAPKKTRPSKAKAAPSAPLPQTFHPAKTTLELPHLPPKSPPRKGKSRPVVVVVVVGEH